MSNLCKELQLKIILYPPRCVYIYYFLSAKKSNTCTCPNCTVDPLTVEVYWDASNDFDRFIISGRLIDNMNDSIFVLRNRIW